MKEFDKQCTRRRAVVPKPAILAQAPEKAPFVLSPDFPLTGGEALVLRERKIDRLHVHNVLEIGLCLEGRGVFVVEDKVFPFAPDDVFIINHLEPHRACMPDGRPSRWRFILTDPAALLGAGVTDSVIMDTGLLSGAHFSNRFTKNDFPEIHSLTVGLVREVLAKNAHYREAVRARLLLLMLELARFTEKRLPARKAVLHKRTMSLMSRLSPALTRIARDYTEALSVGELAQGCCMGSGHFRRVFRSVFRKSPVDYLNDFRIGMCCNLLSTTDKAITDIALSCGYQTFSCFNRQFRKRKKCSPREWRQRRG
jgi:AraC-like DNA-binding protein